MKLIENYCKTITYITCIPLCKIEDDATQLAGLSKYLAPVGFLIGLILAAEFGALSYIHSNQIISALLITISWFFITGGLHFDGLMDTADGIFSHRSPERMIEIMSDSRTGNFGAIIGMSVLLTKFACLITLPTVIIPIVLFLIPGWARWCATYAISAFPYAKNYGKGKIWHESSSFPNDALVSAVLPIIITLFAAAFTNISWMVISTITIATIAGGILCAFWIYSIIKGQTGDTYGCIVELAEVAALLTAALSMGNGKI